MKAIHLIVVRAIVAGYLAHGVIRAIGTGVEPAQAEVAGMDYQALARDRDFKKAVVRVIDGNCYVEDDGYVYC